MNNPGTRSDKPKVSSSRLARKSSQRSEEPFPKRKTPLASKVLLFLGALSVYNVFSHYQTIADLSSSIHWLAQWWRYIISLPFRWLGIDLSPLQREAITLIVFFTGAASFALYKEIGSKTFKMWTLVMKGKLEWDNEDFKRVLYRQSELPALWYIPALIVTFVGTLLFAFALPDFRISISIWVMAGAPLVMPAVMFLLLRAIAISERADAVVPIKILGLLARAITIVPGIIVNWMIVIAAYSQEIAKTLSLLLIILTFDLVARYTVDPFIEAYPTLPSPPIVEESHGLL